MHLFPCPVSVFGLESLIYLTLHNTGSMSPVPQNPKSRHSTVFFIDLNIFTGPTLFTPCQGQILMGPVRSPRPIVKNLARPDGIGISLRKQALFWTCMGLPDKSDDAIYSSSMDGAKVSVVLSPGSGHSLKQLAVDDENLKLYFCDQQGLRVMRCDLDGQILQVLIETGDPSDREDAADESRWCTGIGLSLATGKFYWTQKGPPKGNRGRLFRASIDFPDGKDAKSRGDVETLLQGLPEPMDVAIDDGTDTLYWTDRGEIPIGNSVNSVKMSELKDLGQDASPSLAFRDYHPIMWNLHEAIGIAVDADQQQLYVTDLGGSLYQIDIATGLSKIIHERLGTLTGVAVAYLS